MTAQPGTAGPEDPWEALAAELAPAKSLARLDAATARVVSTVSVVATLLTGLGLIAAGLPSTAGTPRTLAVAAVVLAFLAVLCALTAQVVSVIWKLNPKNLAAVERWYTRRFRWRAPLTWAASALLVLAAGTAGWAAVLALTADRTVHAFLAVTRTAELPEPSPSPSAPGSGPAAEAPLSTVTVDVTFRGLDAARDEAITVTVTSESAVLAQAALVPGADGVASRTLTIQHVPQRAVTVDARGGGMVCTGTLQPGQAAQANCT